MKNGEKNEIDLLLRKLAQRQNSRIAAAGQPKEEIVGAGDHLDPDELSSFAEGVLPVATRSLYTAHLADCSRCRKIVAELALASGVALRPVAAEPEQSKLRRYLASFFSPAVMRYAVPALSLAVLVTVGVIWLRQTGESDYVAKRVEQAEEPVTTQPLAGDVPAEESTETSGFVKQGPGRVEATEEKKSRESREAAGAGATDSLEKDAAPAAVTEFSVPPPPARVADANIAGAKPSAEVQEQEKKEEVAASAPAVTRTGTAKSDERSSRQDQEAAVARQKAKEPPPLQVAGRSASGETLSVRPAATRTVGGRQFRRVNNVWIDTAYDPGAQTISVSRSSEQYRALTGDEPGLRTIAEQLDGEIIVVWKGRAYRIR